MINNLQSFKGRICVEHCQEALDAIKNLESSYQMIMSFPVCDSPGGRSRFPAIADQRA